MSRAYTRILSTAPELEAGNVADKFDLAFGVEVESGDGAIGIKEGRAIITKGSAAALTLVAPTAGLPKDGGDDGKVLDIVDTTGFAHTVTCPSNKINGTKAVATFDGNSSPLTAAIGATLRLIAYQGVWYASANSAISLT